MITILSNEVLSVSISHQRCDGTYNAVIVMKDNSEIELFSLNQKYANSVEYYATHPDMTIQIDERFTRQSENQWLSQNGISQKVGC